ncbi:MAG TPA: hypothetical protein VL979_03335 [Solirubrobacteraceae bacterium]|nr:hypothetical protein [Solirubrobacteraceae bacterium]
MTRKVRAGAAMRAAAAVVTVGLTAALCAATASAAGSIVYNNLNTVPATVNGLPDQDTFSAAPFEFPFGGMVEFSPRPGVIKTLTAQVDSFTCEHGVYNLENCYTARPSKKFHYTLKAEIFEVGAGEEPAGSPIATATQTFKIPYRPTTNVSCPATGEGKGFGPNCDVGGYLAQVEFKHFSPAAVLPQKAIIEITNTAVDSPSDVVNVGLQAAYKEYAGGEYFAEAPAEGGVPRVGSDPLPEDVYIRGALSAGGWTGFQPVFEVTAKA